MLHASIPLCFPPLHEKSKRQRKVVSETIRRPYSYTRTVVVDVEFLLQVSTSFFMPCGVKNRNIISTPTHTFKQTPSPDRLAKTTFNFHILERDVELEF
jgi:hypothetical protein